MNACPQCGRAALRWETRVVRNQPVDTCACDACGFVVAEEDWQLPLDPPRAGRCINCGGARTASHCRGCGLDDARDRGLHEELRDLIDSSVDFFTAAVRAEAGGRRLLALKLSTASAVLDPRPSRGRALRLGLLADLGQLEAATLDARDWVRDQGGAEPGAWNLFGALLVEQDRMSEALEAMDRSLALDPQQPGVRSMMAACLLRLERYGRAQEEAWQALADGAADIARDRALSVLGHGLLRLLEQGDSEEVQRRLADLGGTVERSPELLCARAWLSWLSHDDKHATRDLVAARKLSPEDPLVAQVEQALGLDTRSWWDRT